MHQKRFYKLLDKKFIGTDELRKNLTDILKNLPKTEDVAITQYGIPKAVLVDIKTYVNLRRTTQTYH